jgi:hypothetical protein
MNEMNPYAMPAPAAPAPSGGNEEIMAKLDYIISILESVVTEEAGEEESE